MPKGKGYGSPARQAGVAGDTPAYSKGKGRKQAGRGNKGRSEYANKSHKLKSVK